MNLIPMPQALQKRDGCLAWEGKVAPQGAFEQTQAYVRSVSAQTSDTGNAVAIRFEQDSSVAAQGYRLEVGADGARICASDEAGAFYAYMTLQQLRDGKDCVPYVTVSDAPKYAYRGFMLDCARHFWTIDKIKQILDVMAALKMNEFHWHLSEDQGWRAEIKKYPLLTEKGSIRNGTQVSPRDSAPDSARVKDAEYGRGLYYTQEQMREIVAYAAQRHIEVIPEIDMPGHMVAAIACYPELSCRGEATEVSPKWGVLDNICCCGKEDVYRFAKDVIDELVEIFPGRFFHIGGDEVPKKRWKECPACQKKIRELGLKDENALQGYFNNQIAEYLRSKGKRMIAWNEALDARENLSRDVVAQWWVHHSAADRAELGWMKDGGNCILSYVSNVYMDHSYAIRPLKKTYCFSHKTMRIRDDRNVIGMEIPMWTEYVRDEEKLDMLLYARLIAFAEACWTPIERRDYKQFETRLEAMRPYFARMRAAVCPQPLYRGKSLPWYTTSPGRWMSWKQNTSAEVDYMHALQAQDAERK